MSTLYELVEWDDFGFNIPRALPYAKAKTIAEAVSNVHSASVFVVAVENGVRRPLTTEEEFEFRSADRPHENPMKQCAKITSKSLTRTIRNDDKLAASSTRQSPFF